MIKMTKVLFSCFQLTANRVDQLLFCQFRESFDELQKDSPAVLDDDEMF